MPPCRFSGLAVPAGKQGNHLQVSPGLLALVSSFAALSPACRDVSGLPAIINPGQCQSKGFQSVKGHVCRAVLPPGGFASFHFYTTHYNGSMTPAISTSGRGRPRAFDRNEALKAALRVFWQRGYAPASVAELEAARELGAAIA